MASRKRVRGGIEASWKRDAAHGGLWSSWNRVALAGLDGLPASRHQCSLSSFSSSRGDGTGSPSSDRGDCRRLLLDTCLVEAPRARADSVNRCNVSNGKLTMLAAPDDLVTERWATGMPRLSSFDERSSRDIAQLQLAWRSAIGQHATRTGGLEGSNNEQSGTYGPNNAMLSRVKTTDCLLLCRVIVRHWTGRQGSGVSAYFFSLGATYGKPSCQRGIDHSHIFVRP